MKHQITLVVGDWSGDGHGRTQIVGVVANMTRRAVEQAYLDGCAKVGINLSDNVCRGYEDNSIDTIDMNKLISAGVVERYERKTDEYTFVEFFLSNKQHLMVAWEEDEVGVYNTMPEAFATLYMGIAQLGDPNLEWTIVNPDTINIGGYGLFQ